MLEIVLPTPHRIAKGDLETYTTNEGVERVERKRGLDYHDLLHREGILTDAQYAACRRLIELHTAAQGKFRTVLGTLLPATFSPMLDAEYKFDAGYRYRFIMNAMVMHEREVLCYLLFHGATVEQAARGAGIGKAKVRPAFVSACRKAVEAITQLRELERDSHNHRGGDRL